VSDDLHAQLAAAIERYLEILTDHGLILDAECDSFVQEPVYGVHTVLADAMQILDPDYPRTDRLQSTCGPDETHDRLEAQLIEFVDTLAAICANQQASTGVDPFTAIDDPTIGRVAVALLSSEIAVERLRGQAAAHGQELAGPASRALAELEAEDPAAAIERHCLTRLAVRP